MKRGKHGATIERKKSGVRDADEEEKEKDGSSDEDDDSAQAESEGAVIRLQESTQVMILLQSKITHF